MYIHRPIDKKRINNIKVVDGELKKKMFPKKIR